MTEVSSVIIQDKFLQSLILIALCCLTKYLTLLHPRVKLTSPRCVSNVAFFIDVRSAKYSWRVKTNLFKQKEQLTLTSTKCCFFSHFFNFNTTLCIEGILIFTEVSLHSAITPLRASDDSYLKQLV